MQLQAMNETSLAAYSLPATGSVEESAGEGVKHPDASHMQAAEELVAAIPATDKQFVKVPDAFHELLLGAGSKERGQAISEWILARCQPSKL